jgi:threonine dehydratase
LGGVPDLVAIDAIRSARELLHGVIRPTAVDHSETLTRLAARPVWLKHEYRQRTGSFKIRGAYTHIARLADTARANGVVAASAGNHAQGVALAATLLGVQSTIFMPEVAPLPKVEATRAYGADVRLCGAYFEDALAAALEFTETAGAHFVSPFDDLDVIAGQGTIGLELDEQVPTDVTTFVVAVGGGGLISGIATALRASRPSCRVIGVEAEGAASMCAALAAGAPVLLDRIDTMADGIANKRVSELTLAHVQQLVDEVVTVTEEEISRALLLLLERQKAVVEPAGATALAAVLAGKVAGDDAAAVLLSGGNVDPLLLVRVIGHGLSAAGRYLVVRVTLHDRPGELHRLLGLIATMGLNVVDIEHHRSGVNVPVDQAEVRFTLETRDPGHRDEVVDALRAAGYDVVQA